MADNFGKPNREENPLSVFEEDGESHIWSAVSSAYGHSKLGASLKGELNFSGKNLENGKFEKENLEGANFSVANLSGVDFSGANLRGVDFSGANLNGARFNEADLTGANLSGAILVGADFTKAILKHVKLYDADIEDAILVDAILDDMTIEELQELVEYLAQHYPHKLNLKRLNLTVLNLARIDLSKVNLRGVDFTGVNFTGVNIFELDLSECIITPEQIAQALGRQPKPEELKKILAPKNRKKNNFGLDLYALFFGSGKTFGVIDVNKAKCLTADDLVKFGKKVYKTLTAKPEPKSEEIIEEFVKDKEQKTKNHNDEVRKIIEERKRQELENRQEKQKEFKREIIERKKEKVAEQKMQRDSVRIAGQKPLRQMKEHSRD